MFVCVGGVFVCVGCVFVCVGGVFVCVGGVCLCAWVVFLPASYACTFCLTLANEACRTSSSIVIEKLF